MCWYFFVLHSICVYSDIVIPRVKSICPGVKLLAILRNPTDRAFSQYQMCVDTSGTPEQMQVRGLSSYLGKSFSEVVSEEISELQRLGVTPACSYEHFKSVFLSNRPMTHGGHSIVARGLYALQLEPWLAEFAARQEIKVLSISQLKGDKAKVKYLPFPPRCSFEFIIIIVVFIFV